MPTDAALPPTAPPSPSALLTIAAWIVILVGLWHLLVVLEDVLEPFFLAVMLGYGILPAYLRLKLRMGRFPALALMGVGSVLIAVTLTLVFSASIVQLNEQFSDLKERYDQYRRDLLDYVNAHFPRARAMLLDIYKTEGGSGESIRRMLGGLGRTVASVISIAAVVTLYLLFMLVEAGRFPERVQRSFPQRHIMPISETINSISRAMTEYIGGKLLSSLLLALPVGILLKIFGIELAAFWALLTFFCNFVPYFGSVVACGTPLAYAFLKLDYGWEPIILAILLVGIHVAAALFVEPIILGKAVGLSPLLILLALTFWGSCWGFVGILLAVPLSAMFVIVLQNIPATRPVGLFLADG